MPKSLPHEDKGNVRLLLLPSTRSKQKTHINKNTLHSFTKKNESLKPLLHSCQIILAMKN